MRKYLLTLLFLSGWLLAGTSLALAAGVVGDGNPTSCTETALTTALTGGGVVTFNCGNDATITLTADQPIATTTTVDGGGKVTLQGGAFVVAPNVTFTVNNLTMRGSPRAALVNNGGVVTINASHFLSNTNTSDGGAIVNQNGALTINSTTFEKNRGANGGAIVSTGNAPLLIDDSDFIENQATVGNGGAISLTTQSGLVTFSKTTFFSNEAGNRESGSGGALAVGANSRVTFVNATLVGNHAAGSASGGGHALYLTDGAIVTATNTTIAFHSFDRGAASVNVAIWAEPAARVALANSILHESECVGPTTNNGHNVASFATNGCNISNVSSTALLDVYNTNGGRHITYQPRKGGAAYDKIDSNLCPATDQRGISRPQGTKCDIGAIEYAEPTISSLTPEKAQVRDNGMILTVNGQNLLDGMVVRWNGVNLATTFINTTQLQAVVPADKLLVGGTATIQVYAPNRLTSNTLALPIVETVTPDLQVTVSDQPDSCGTQTTVTVLPNAPVTICYTLHNRGSMTLTRHTLSDTWLGQILTDEELLIEGGESHVIKRTFAPPYSLSILGSWTAKSIQDEVGFAQATATVNVRNPKLALTATVGKEANVCATTKTVTINYGEKVTYCVTVTNQGDTTLDTHTLTDSVWGERFKNEVRALAPGASYSYLYEVTPQRSRQSQVTWTAVSSALPNAPQSASDTVNVTITEQDFRDVGELRIWADRFVTNGDGSTTASSRVRIGPKRAGSDSKYYSVNTMVIWRDNGPVAGTGIIGTADGDIALMEGNFTVDTTDGVITWDPGAQLRYTYLGASGIQLSNPSISFTMMQPVVQGSGSFTINLIGNEPIAATLNFTVNVDGTVGSAFSPVSLKLGGATLTGQLSADALGLRITQGILDLPTPGPLALPDLIINQQGETGIHFASELSGSPAPLPDMDLGNGILSLLGMTGKIVRTESNALAIELDGTLRVAGIRDNPTIDTPIALFRLADKKITGVVGAAPNLIVEGFPLQFLGTELKARPLGGNQTGFEYYLEAPKLTLGVPAKWDLPVGQDKTFEITKNVVVSTLEPNVRLQIDKVPVPKTFSLLGNARKSVHIFFSDVKVTIKYAEAGLNWYVELEGTLNFKLGKDTALAPGVKIVYKNGKAAAMLTDVALKVAGLGLNVKDMAYIDDVFTAASAKLSLPQAWGGSEVSISKVRIDDSGLKLGEVDGKFPIPDFSLFSVLQVSNTTATLATDAKTTYAVVLTTTLTITNVEVLDNANASATGALRIADGRVSGNVTGFGFKLVGLGFRVDKAQFLDDRIKAETVGLTLPSSLGGAATTISGLEIGGQAGFAIRGGSFKLPDFAIGTVGFKNINAQFEKDEAGNYLIGAGAKLGFEAFSVEGEFKLAYEKATDNVQVRRVFLAYEGQIAAGTAIPIADTGFFITRVSGSFDLNAQTLRVSLGVRAAQALEVAGKSALAVEGVVTVQARPFMLTTNASTYLVGLKVNDVNMVITSHSVRLDSTVEYQVYRATMRLAFGKDIDDEFTMFGRMYAEVGLKKGSIGKIDLGIFGEASIPPFDMVLSGEGWEAGKFKHDKKKVWGGRIIRSLFGFDAYVFLRLAPSIGVDAGFNLDSYKPILPALTAQGGAAGATALPYTVNVTRTTTTLVVLEAVTQTNWLNPQNIQVISPNGAPFTLNLEYASAEDKVTRIYTIKITNPEQAMGAWQILPQAGNVIAIWGVDQPPTVSSFEAAANNVALATVDQNSVTAAAQPQTITGGALAFAWQASNNEPGFTVDLYLEGEGGMRYLLNHQESVNETTLRGNINWTPALPTGIYTPTLVVDDFRNVATTVRKAPILLQDTTAPTAPQALTAQARADGSVLLTWQPATEKDLAGYAVAVNGGAAIRELGKVTQYEVFGLTPGATAQIAVAAYDLSGNMGTPAVVTVGLPTVGVNALTPARNGQYSDTISIVFDQVITPTAFSLATARGESVAGSAYRITDEVVVIPDSPATATVSETAVITNVITSVTVGMRFVPAAPLPAGAYIATARATALDGTPVEVSWPFTVLPTLHELTVQVNGSGSVAVQGAPCDSTCTTSHAAGSVVNLTAEAAPGFIFSGWSGACSGTDACQVTMNGNQSVVATFVPVPTYGLTVQVSGNGTVSGQGITCGTDCTETYPAGTVVKLAATPAQGFVFNGWSGACTGTSECSVTLNSNQSVVATFVPAPPTTYTLTVQVSGNGSVTGNGIACGADCMESYPAGTVVALTATPAQGFVFSGWSGACTGTGECSVTLTSDQSVTATFAPAPPATYGLTVQVVGNGSVTGNGIACGADCTESYAAGTGVTLTATPAQGFVFSGWNGACTGTGACTLTMDGDKLVTATFTAVPPPSANLIYLSGSKDSKLGKLKVGDEDILAFNPANGSWSLVWDGSDVGIKGDLDDFAILNDGSILMSFEQPEKINGMTVADADLVRFIPTTLGANTTGRFEFYFDGSDVGLTTNAEDIDAFAVLPNGDLLISTRGLVIVPGVIASDIALLRFTPSSLGLNTAGTWSIALRGISVGLNILSESVRSVWVAPDGQLYLTSEGNFHVNGGLRGDGDDIFVCTPSAPPTVCTFSRFWDGAAVGFTGGFIDGLDLHSSLTLVASAENEETVEEASDESDLVDDGDVVDDNEPVIEEVELNQRLFLPIVSNN